MSLRAFDNSLSVHESAPAKKSEGPEAKPPALPFAFRQTAEDYIVMRSRMLPVPVAAAIRLARSV
jgi:hypothetical protein